MHEITYFVKLKQKRCFVKTKPSQSGMLGNVCPVTDSSSLFWKGETKGA